MYAFLQCIHRQPDSQKWLPGYLENTVYVRLFTVYTLTQPDSQQWLPGYPENTVYVRLFTVYTSSA
jgi:hypothetical protein